jgi:predicted O-methyltransferase YrrM
MIRKLKTLVWYFKYQFLGQTKHDVHSPFVFDLLNWVIEDTTPFYIYSPIEALRSRLLLSKKTIAVTDFGAGSAVHASNIRGLSSIAKHALKPAKYAQLLFRLVRHFKPDTILELGTSLGISSLYMASPRSMSRLITLEGCPAKNIRLITGAFKETLPIAIAELKHLDFVFFDGHHQKEATLNYFAQCLPYAGNDSVFIFDDIYWSEGMREAWEAIKRHSSITVTIDLFYIGIVFFRKEQEKQHFTLKF